MAQDPPFQEEVVAKIVGNVRVQSHLESLAKQKTKKDMRKARSSLPKELNKTYDDAMKKIRSQDPESVRVAEHVLAWISNARRPFSVDELQHALAVQPGENNFDEERLYAEDDLVSVCAELVTVDRESQVTRLVHHTTHDYIQGVRNKTFPRNIDTQIEIAKACITYLGFDDFESERYTHGKERIEVSDEMRSKYPFLDHAGKYWGHHARGPPVHVLGVIIFLFLGRELRGLLACDLIDDSAGYWDFGPMPALTILVHFGLERLVSSLDCFDEEESALICAIRYRKDTLVFLFVERGACWHDSAENFVVAECSPHKLEGNENMVRILAKHGMTMDLGVDNGDFLFIWALLKWSGAEERRAMPDLLLIGGDDFDVRGLLNDGVTVNEKDRHERDALIYAALARHEAVVVRLLEAGADVHSSDEDGMTALCAACKGGNERIVRRLLESGADISAQDRFGQTAMSIATESGNAPILRLLRDHETGDHSEAGIEADTKAVVDEAQPKAEINEVIALFIRDRDVGLPDNKFIQVVRREAIRRGYDKIVPAIWDAILKEKERENDPMIVAEQDTEGS